MFKSGFHRFRTTFRPRGRLVDFLVKPGRRRAFSSKNGEPVDPATEKARGRMDRVLSRFPKFMSNYTARLRSAPLSHITAFLLLHEITAITPVVGLAYFFHRTGWLPPGMAESKWAISGAEKFGNYFAKKGWFGFGKVDEHGKRVKGWRETGFGSVRILLEVATAYAVVKALLPLRLIISIWGTPWFARLFVVPITSRVGRMFGMKKKVPAVNAVGGAAGGTGAVGGGAVGKSAKGSGEVGKKVE